MSRWSGSARLRRFTLSRRVVVSVERNKAAVRRYVDDVFNAGNLAVLDKVIDLNIAYREPTRQIDGREAFKQGLSGYLATFGNPRLTIDDLVADADRASFRWTLRGTPTASMMGVAPTGKEVTFSGITFLRLEGGRFVEWWGQWDVMSLMRQIEAMPAAPG
jgi:predicted ester cyclase